MSDLAGESEQIIEGLEYPFRLVSVRAKHVINSAMNDARAHGKPTHNPAYMHPDDLLALNLSPHDSVVIQSARAEIRAFVEADDGLRRGLVAITAGYGGRPDGDEDIRSFGSNPGKTARWLRLRRSLCRNAAYGQR